MSSVAQAEAAYKAAEEKAAKARQHVVALRFLKLSGTKPTKDESWQGMTSDNADCEDCGQDRELVEIPH